MKIGTLSFELKGEEMALSGSNRIKIITLEQLKNIDLDAEFRQWNGEAVKIK